MGSGSGFRMGTRLGFEIGVVVRFRHRGFGFWTEIGVGFWFWDRGRVLVSGQESGHVSVLRVGLGFQEEDRVGF